jgi:hypothetical protein
VQIERFPSSAAPVPRPSQVVYFQPGQQPIGPAPGKASKKATPAESLGQGGFRRIWPNGGSSTNLRLFRPTYSSSLTSAAEAYPDVAPNEERIRMLAETLVETLVQMLS